MEQVFFSWAVHFDLPVLDWIREMLTCPLLDGVMPVITTLGNAGIAWILLAVGLLITRKYRGVGIRMAAALLMGLILCNLLLKPLCGRIRPYDLQLQEFGRIIPLLIPAQQDFSFPSGHTIASFEAATVLFCYNKKWGIAAVILAGLIAFSRLYLYVHYPSDVLCSVVLGIGIGVLVCRRQINRYR